MHGRSLRRLLSGAVLVPLLALTAMAGHAIALRCRWTGQAMELTRCCPGQGPSSPEHPMPALRAQGCCSLERTDLDTAPAQPASSPQADARPGLEPIALPMLAATPRPFPAREPHALAAPRPPPLAQRLALKRSRLI
jgi:hypothetical protein